MRRGRWLAALLLVPRLLSGAGHPRLRAVEEVLAPLVESYGVSGMEGPVRETVRRLLPGWAHTQTDTAGNLWLTMGRGEPTVVFVAHLDEIGFRVTAIRDDGTLDAEAAGGPFLGCGRAARAGAHRRAASCPACSCRAIRWRLRTGRARSRRCAWTSAPPTGRRPKRSASGRATRHEPQALRAAGSVRAPPAAHSTTGSARPRWCSLRGGSIRPARHTVIFIWSVREEIGLEGAAVAAAALGLRPARVHAIDTFVSADSPLERRNFAVAPLGRGPVARALDNSAVTPPAYVDSLTALARARGIPLQVGTTNGGNDGSAFSDWGVPDVPIGWPLRYSHSPAEVVDLRDVAALADLVQAAAEGW